MSSIPDRLSGVHPQMLRAEHEDNRKKVAALVARAFTLMGITKQEAAYRMGYTDAGTVSRWCSATERPLFDKLIGLDGFEIAYVLAIAERNAAIDVTTTITVRRIA